MARPRKAHTVEHLAGEKRTRRPHTATLSMSDDELSAFHLLAAIHGYGSLVPFLRRVLLDCATAHELEVSAADYPLRNFVTREEALQRAHTWGTYTPPPAWWEELHGLG